MSAPPKQLLDDSEPLSSPAAAPPRVLRKGTLLLFQVCYTAISSTAVSPLLYFYRTGYACFDSANMTNVSLPGEPGWSGSVHCNNTAGVLGAAQPLWSSLVPMQLACQLLFTPVFSALADRSGHLTVIAAGLGFFFLGMALLWATAVPIPARAAAFLAETPSAADGAADGAATLVMSLGTLIAARLALGVAASCVPAPTTALFLSMAPADEVRGRYVMVLLACRGLGGAVGAAVGISVVNSFVTDYTTFFGPLAAAAALQPLLLLRLRGHTPRTRGGTAWDRGGDEHVGELGELGGKPPLSARSICRSLAEASADPRLRLLLTAVSLAMFGLVGPASFLASYLQSAFLWQQGRFPLVSILVMLPSALVGAIAFRRYAPAMPGAPAGEGGLVGGIKAGFFCQSGASLVLCTLPWWEGAIYLYCALLGLGATQLPNVLVLVAQGYPIHQQAQVQGFPEPSLNLPCTFPVPSLYLPCTFRRCRASCRWPPSSPSGSQCPSSAPSTTPPRPTRPSRRCPSSSGWGPCCSPPRCSAAASAARPARRGGSRPPIPSPWPDLPATGARLRRPSSPACGRTRSSWAPARGQPRHLDA